MIVSPLSCSACHLCQTPCSNPCPNEHPGFSSSTPAQQGRLQIHSTLASPGQLSSLTQSSPTSRAPLPTALSHAPSADRGSRPTAGLPFPPAGWLHHPAISSNPSSPSNRVCARASWAITTSRPRHHSPVPEVGPSFDHYWSKRHVTEHTRSQLSVAPSLTPPPCNQCESGQRIFQAGVNVTRTRQEHGRGRFDVSMAWASTHTCLDNCLHSAERHASTPMLLS